MLGDLSISRSPVLSLFSTNKNTKSAKTTIYTELFTWKRQRVVYMAQKKARQALDRSRKVVNTKIYMYRVVYMAQTKAGQALDRSRKVVNIKTYI